MAEEKLEKTQKLYKPTVAARELAERLFKESGIEFEGDFFAHVMATYELQQMKTSLGAGYQKQISSLEYHLKSVAEHFTSMLQTEHSERQELIEGYEEKVVNLSGELTAQQDEISHLKHKLAESDEHAGKTLDENTELRKYITSIENLNSKNEQILIENKDRIERLSKMVLDGQDAITKKQELETKVSELLQISNEQNRTIEQMTASQKEFSEAVKRDQKKAEEQHADRLKETKLSAKLEADQAMVELKRVLQDELAAARNEHASDLRKLYAEIDGLRQQLADARQTATANAFVNTPPPKSNTDN
ncbi:hypothetical protein JI735_34700 (plasmid) [Paenibacillus sonchi]|uniref:Uncharacterized protein n=1 Tax=Paenibacillus sonchi TaxID=373687 RepID=A0A974PIZ7_9BACL|nr:hypothetical protein [Paenibacillus sonchi]QQZ64580.1 hypothetical protein JI735_34700 [Paenibacillus sonchi]